MSSKICSAAARMAWRTTNTWCLVSGDGRMIQTPASRAVVGHRRMFDCRTPELLLRRVRPHGAWPRA
ncbi:hypothetical protein [Streptomyces angustmyceticus]|uniref:hypothetical protein n=1 Tax=Streptomyces angustmyceticus TaxID=285578 RepID=UPI00382DDAD1